MKLIHENPYRIIGILSNASAREVQSRKGKINAYVRVGKEITSDYDFPFLLPVVREQKNIDKAFSAIQQSNEILDHSLFWFSNSNPFDETAISYLINSDREKAMEIWRKVTFGKEISPKNISSFNNISTLQLLGSSRPEIKEGIETKAKLIDSAHFKDFVHTVVGEAHIVDKGKQLEAFTASVLKELNGKFSNDETLHLFENTDEHTRDFLINKLSVEPFHRIETAIESTKKKRNQAKIDAL